MTFGKILILLVFFLIIYKLFYQEKATLATTNTFALSAHDICLLENSYHYFSLGMAMVACVSGCFYRCDLERPTKLPTHLAPFGKRVTCDPQRGVMFTYVFSRAITGKSGMEILYSTTNTGKMVSILNQSLGNYTVQLGYHNLQIVAHGNLEQGRVFFSIAPFTPAEIQQNLYILRNEVQGGY